MLPSKLMDPAALGLNNFEKNLIAIILTDVAIAIRIVILVGMIILIATLSCNLTSQLLLIILSSMSVMTIACTTVTPNSLDKILCRISNLT